MQWTKVFDDYLARKIWTRTIYLCYVTTSIPQTKKPASSHAKVLSHTLDFVSFEEIIVAWASYTHALYHEDNADVYLSLEEAMRDTQYAASIKPFQQVKNGRGALASIKQQFTGTNKWQAELSQRNNFFHLAEWKGQMSAQSCLHLHKGGSRICAIPTTKQTHKSWIPAIYNQVL
eukprot:3666689-Ditylum_brightwellii.AAC.1